MAEAQSRPALPAQQSRLEQQLRALQLAFIAAQYATVATQAAHKA